MGPPVAEVEKDNDDYMLDFFVSPLDLIIALQYSKLNNIRSHLIDFKFVNGIN